MSDSRKRAKRPKNVLVDADAVARGERYSRRHGISLSQLLGDFLRSLPLEADAWVLTPAVRRLWGVASGKDGDREAYRQHLVRKHGSQ